MTSTVTRENVAAQADFRPQVLGALAAAGGLLYAIAGLRITFDNDSYDTLLVVLALLWCLGCLAGLVGIMLLGVVGRGLLGRAAFGLAFAGSAFALLAWLTGFNDPQAVEESVLIIIGRVLTVLGFVGLGIATIKAGVWSGWRRFTPFFYPLAAVLGGVAWGVAEVELTMALIGLSWLAIGSIIATSSPVGDRRVSQS
jgi:hypothetical protein